MAEIGATRGRTGTPAPAVAMPPTARRVLLAAVLPAAVLPAAVPPAAMAQETPPGVTAQTVERGRQLYLGEGFCDTCHGRDGRGLPDLGADLTSGDWIYSDGTLEGLAEVIREGVPAETSATGIAMPPGGGARLSAEQVRAVAAYVWTLSHGGPGGVP